MKRPLIVLLYISLLSCLPLTTMAQSYLEKIEQGFAAEDEDRFGDAIELLTSALPQIPSDSVQLTSDVYVSIVTCYYRLGKFEQALEYGQLSLGYDEASGSLENLSSSLSNMGAICMAAHREDLGVQYLQRAIGIEQQLGRKDKLAIRMGMLSEIYTQMTEYEKALPLIEEALKLEEEIGNPQKIAIRHSQLGNTLLHMNRFAESEEHLKQGEALHRQFNNLPSLALTLLSRAVSARCLNKYAEAERCVTECIEIAQQIGMNKIRMDSYHEMARIYKLRNDMRAYDYMLEYTKLKDSITTQQVQEQIADMEVRYQTREKEQQIAMDEVIIARQRLVYLSLAVLLILSIVALVFLMRSLKLKEQNMQLRNRFTRLISHDLKNPALAQQQGLQQLCRYLDILDNTTLRQELTHLSQDADAQVDLLYDLLDWSSLQTGKLSYSPLRFDLVQLAQEVIKQHRGQAQIKGIDLLADNQSTDPFITSDRQMVASILRNAISNAIKFTNTGGQIRVIIADQRISVQDNGRGFDVAKQQKQKSSEAGTRDEKGSALGLNLARQMATLTHSKLEIDSKIGQGTTINLTFQADK